MLLREVSSAIPAKCLQPETANTTRLGMPHSVFSICAKHLRLAHVRKPSFLRETTTLLRLKKPHQNTFSDARESLMLTASCVNGCKTKESYRNDVSF
jgi:hypothetical protein